MCQSAVRGDLFRDLRWCDMKCITTHEPKMHEDDSRYPMMGFVEKYCRKCKVVNTKKKYEECGGTNI